MALADLLKVERQISNPVREEITPERIADDVPKLKKLIAYWRVYPDKFVDYLCSLNPNNRFKFYFYQRMYLRAAMRYKHVYCVYPRGYSKSFLAVLCLFLKCVLYPGSRIFVVSGGKEQSASILSSKASELCKLIPALENEIVWDTRSEKTARTRSTRDSVVYTFKNGSELSNVALSEKTRGQRFQAGLIEECASIDQDLLNEVILPTLVVQRTINGQVDDREVLNQSQIFITSAGYKNTFAYEKLIQFLCESVARPDEAIVLGGTWRIPVMEKLQPRNFIQQLKMDGTFNEASFEREFESHWAGAVDGAFFDPDKFDRYRDIQLAENEYSKKTSEGGYYVLGVDVGRTGCTTEVVVCKVTPAQSGVPRKQIVNIFSFEEEHFGYQAIQIKRLFRQFKCRVAVIDANGLGIGLVDFLVMDQQDPDTGEDLGNLGVYNDEDGKYKKFQNENTIPSAMYLLKANAVINTELYAYCQTQLGSGKIHFLIDENVAKNKLAAQSQSQRMNQSKRADYMRPYVMTSILRDQMMNLIEENEGVNIILKQATRTIKKDKFSALIYALYWSKLQEDSKKKRKGIDINRMMLFTKH